MDYLERFQPWFSEGGFRRLLSGGRVYSECRLTHAVTKTAPGHATILSGVNADIHGIIANDWITSMDGGPVWTNAVEDDQSPLVGLSLAAGEVLAESARLKAGRSPRNFLASTVGDQLKLRHGSRARVVSISDKDRSAILLGGKLADSAYWRERDGFVTSSYYRPDLPSWVLEFNRVYGSGRYFGRKWDRLLEASVYDRTQGADPAPGEADGVIGMSNRLPKVIDGGHPSISEDFYRAFEASPFAVTQLIDFALAAIRSEGLGVDDIPDLFCIGISQTDWNGHLFGPDSHEVMDGFLRLDREIARLLAGLDASVGLGHYVVVVTADHGVSPLPEVVQQRGSRVPAGRLDGKALDDVVQASLSGKFGPLAGGIAWAVRDNASYRLNPAALHPQSAGRPQVAEALKQILLQQPGIAAAYTREDLLGFSAAGQTDGYSYLQRRSYNRSRGADVVYQLKPYFIEKEGSGTTHGTPYDYDRHVPLLWFGSDITPGTVATPVAVEDIAPTLAALLGVPRPPQAGGRRLF